jgi:hypothetical protein
VVLSHDTSSCSCIFVTLPPPSDAVLVCWCVSTPVMREAVCLLYVCAAMCCVAGDWPLGSASALVAVI